MPNPKLRFSIDSYLISNFFWDGSIHISQFHTDGGHAQNLNSIKPMLSLGGVTTQEVTDSYVAK